MSKNLIPLLLLLLVGCDSERQKREQAQRAERRAQGEADARQEASDKERGLVAYETAKALGRYQLVSAPVSVIGEAQGKQRQFAYNQVFKIDTTTGETWQFVDDYSASNQMHGWISLEDLHIKMRSPAAESAPDK